MIFVLIVICLVIVGYQNYDRFLLYTMFPYKVDHYYTPGFKGQLPTFTLCGPKQEFISDQFYKELFPDKEPERPFSVEESIIIEEALNNKSITEQFSDFSIQELVQQIDCKFSASSLPSDNEGKTCAEMVDISFFLYKHLFCITLNYKNDSSFRYYPDVREDPLMSLEVKFQMSKIMIGLTPSYESVFEVNPNSYEVVDLVATMTTNLFFEKQTIRFLSTPYMTNCYDYAKENGHQMGTVGGLGSEIECRFHYKIRHFQKIFGCVPKNSMPFFKGQSVTICRHDIDEHTLKEMNSHLSHMCNQMCRRDCYKEIYTLMQNEALFDTGANHSHVINVFPADISLNLVYNPVLTFVDLIAPVVKVVLFIISFIAFYLMVPIRMNNKSDKIN